MHSVKDEMTRKVTFVLESDDLDQAYISMRAVNARHVPVTRNGKVVGILSDRDILLHARPAKHGLLHIPKKLVGDVMSRGVVVCRDTDHLGWVAQSMIYKKIDSLPVVNDAGELLGIITSTDLLRVVREDEWTASLPPPLIRAA